MATYVQKPTIIEAIQLSATRDIIISALRLISNTPDAVNIDDNLTQLFILHVIKNNGIYINYDDFVHFGDYIIKDCDGNIHADNPVIFENRYSLVGDNDE